MEAILITNILKRKYIFTLILNDFNQEIFSSNLSQHTNQDRCEMYYCKVIHCLEVKTNNGLWQFYSHGISLKTLCRWNDVIDLFHVIFIVRKQDPCTTYVGDMCKHVVKQRIINDTQDPLYYSLGKFCVVMYSARQRMSIKVVTFYGNKKCHHPLVNIKRPES